MPTSGTERPPATGPVSPLVVAIVNYESWADVERLVSAFAPEVSDGRARLLVIDNASPSPMPPSLDAPPRGVSIVRRPDNGGFAVGVNAAWRMSPGAWLLVLNPDLVAGPSLIPEVLRRIDRFDIPGETPPGVIGFRLTNPDGSTQPSVGVFPTLVRTVREQLIPRSRRKYQPDRRVRPGPVPWVTGACVLLNPAMLDEVGGMDEDFFLYYEEVALCKSARDRGWTVEYDPGVSVTHLRPLQDRAISPKMRVVTRHSKLLYFRKHRPGAEFRILAAIVRVEALARGAWSRLRGRDDERRAWSAIGRLARRMAAGEPTPTGRGVLALAEAATPPSRGETAGE